ncbi:MAG: DoxX family membrane protein [Marinosulfonomonas sp.]|nr:DoxX family membrane protein [Marinosulfonomonas sp.]
MKLTDILANNAHWLLRIAIASVFLFHGVLKFMNLEGFAAMLPISYTQLVFVAMAETGGALLLILGGFGNNSFFDITTRIGATLNIPVMIGAIVKVHWGQWNFLPSETHPIGGIEFQTVLILIMLYIAITGNRYLRMAGSDAGYVWQPA